MNKSMIIENAINALLLVKVSNCDRLLSKYNPGLLPDEIDRMMSVIDEALALLNKIKEGNDE